MNSCKDITEKEYELWLKSADRVENMYSVFTSCCGPHEFANRICKDGILYELSWGWIPEMDDVTRKHKLTYFWRIMPLYRDGGQDGDSI